MPVKTRLRCAGESHVGMVRSNNEDRIYTDPDRGIFLVVDGIGGQAAGEKAAEIAVERVKARLERRTGSTEERIREAITVANNEILEAAAANPEWRGMAEGRVIAGHVGDSRLYQIRRGKIRKITHDHSPVGEREDNQEISEAEAMRHPRRNEVYRDVGSQQHAPDDPDFIEIRNEVFDSESALLLCSDGLSDQVKSAEILETVLANAGHPGGAVHELIEAANRAGGKDNVSVVVVEGERFAESRTAPQAAAVPSGHWFTAKPLVFFYGLVCAALVGFALWQAGWLERQPSVPPPATLTVGVGANSFSSIAAALEKARAGDTVEVASGEYSAPLQMKNGVTVRGKGPDVPVLRLAQPDGQPGAAVVAQNVRGARLLRFAIRSDEKAPLSVGVEIENSDLELQDTDIAGAATGIEIKGSSSAILRANTIHDCVNTGIRITGDAKPWLMFNAVLRNGRRARGDQAVPGSGILIENPARPVLQGNIFSDNGGEAVKMPEQMDRDAFAKFNFLLPAKAPARNRTQGPGSAQTGGAK